MTAPVGQVPALDVGALVAGREADRERLREQIRASGSPEAAVRATYPALGEGFPMGLTEADYVEHGTVAWYEDGAARRQLCGRCPPNGAACSDAGGLFKPGQLAVWQPDRLGRARCDRYVDYRVRERLALAGVPALYRAVTLGGYRTPTPGLIGAREAILALGRAIADGGGRPPSSLPPPAGAQTGPSGPPWLVLSGPRGSGLTHLGAALLRNLVRAAPRLRLRYVDVQALRVELRGWQFDSDEPDPLDKLRQAGVLVLDNLDPETLDRLSVGLRESVEDLLRTRWIEQQPTLVTTHAPVRALLAAFPTITTLDKAPACTVA